MHAHNTRLRDMWVDRSAMLRLQVGIVFASSKTTRADSSMLASGPAAKRKPLASGFQYQGKPAGTSINSTKPAKGFSLTELVRGTILKYIARSVRTSQRATKDIVFAAFSKPSNSTTRPFVAQDVADSHNQPYFSNTPG